MYEEDERKRIAIKRMPCTTNSEAISKLNAADLLDDSEDSHSIADSVLADLLMAAGFTEVVNIYNNPRNMRYYV